MLLSFCLIFIQFQPGVAYKIVVYEKSLYFVLLRLHWNLSTILKTSNNSVGSNVFWYVKVCIFLKCIQYSIHWDQIQILKKFLSDKINRTKNGLFLLLQAPTHHSFTFICDSCMSWSTRFASLEQCVGFSILNSVLLSLKFIFSLNKMHGFFDFKTS